MSPTKIRYFGWSALSIETADGALFFDPFFRRYCGAEWFHLADFKSRQVHLCDPRTRGAFPRCAGDRPRDRRHRHRLASVCSFLKRRRGIAADRLLGHRPATFGSISLCPGFRLLGLSNGSIATSTSTRR